MRFVTWQEVAERIRGKSVAVVGSAPSVLQNAPGFIDAHEVVVRVNNFKTGERQGVRCDAHYSFYGTSIRKTVDELKAAGVTLCLCKCPNSKPLQSAWHEERNKPHGVDFRYIYKARASFWFCDTFIPSDEQFMAGFSLLGKHIPTTGFAAILDVLACEPKSVYLTGYDFFQSGISNVEDPWKPGDPTDPIGHRPMLEAAWIRENARHYPIMLDAHLRTLLLEAA